jgi:hypothetical protein
MELCNILGPRTAQLSLRCGKLRSYNKTRFVTNLQTLNPDAVSSLVVRGQLSANAGEQTPLTKQWLSADNHIARYVNPEGVGTNPLPRRIPPGEHAFERAAFGLCARHREAWILGGRMATHAERLSSIAEARAKGAAEMVQLLLDDDPLSASRRG